MLVTPAAPQVSKADYPDDWEQGALRLPLTYQFEPGTEADGVTVHIPLAVLGRLSPVGFDWQIPGLREEVVTELIRSLPKPIRRHYVPAPNYAKKFLDRAVAGDGEVGRGGGLAGHGGHVGFRSGRVGQWVSGSGRSDA